MPEKYRQEIEDILEQQAGKLAGKGPSKGRGVGKARFGAGFWRLFSPGRLLLASVALLVSFLVVRQFAPGVINVLFWVGLVAFIAAYAMFFVRWGSNEEKRWRGRPLEDRRRFGLLSRLRRKLGI